MKKNIKLLLVALVVLFSLLTTGCKKQEEPEVDPDNGKTPISIDVVKDSIPEALDTEEFDLSVIKITITYEDDTTREANLTESMLDPTVLDELKAGASKRVEIFYKDCSCKANITSINYKALDPTIGSNDVIVMVRRDEKKEHIEIASLSNKGVISFQAAFTFDENNISFKKNTETFETETYTASYQIVKNILYVFVIGKTTTPVTGDVNFMNIEYTSTSNYRKANFTLLQSFDNKVLTFDSETSSNVKVEDVLYHYSQR